MGWSVRPGHLAVRLVVLGVGCVPVVTSAAAGEDLHEPDAPLDQPPGDQAVGPEFEPRSDCPGRRVASVASVSRPRSTASGTAACMRKASSYEAIREDRSSTPSPRAARCSRFSHWAMSSTARSA